MIRKVLPFYLLLLSFAGCREKTSTLIDVKELTGYPSGSGIAYYHDRFFVMGDDATQLLIMDTAFNPIDSIVLFPGSGRIGKEKKADTEAIALISQHQDTSLLLIGSGSVSPYRDSAFIIGPFNKAVHRFTLDTLYRRLKHAGIAEINIEGAAAIPGNIVLANRGNKSFPKNHLVLMPANFWRQQLETPLRIIRTGSNTDTSQFSGISGMDYSYRSDRLFLTVSTENTYSSYADGEIGKSYLWIIRDISAKKRMSALNPNDIIDLEAIDSRFKGQKIESVCVRSESRSETELVLVADNDKGSSTLFHLLIRH